MRRIRGSLAAGAVALTALLTACGSGGSSGSATSKGVGSTTTATAGARGSALGVAKTRLGSVVTGPSGRTVYLYARDTRGSGKSVCTGPCAAVWPAATTTGTPRGSGVSGTVGTIRTSGGKEQLTLDGWPLYYYAGDGAAGQVNGQGIQGIWWALTPRGTKITASAPAAASTTSSSAGGYNQGGGY